MVLKTKVDKVEQAKSKMEQQLDDSEQYGHQNCLLLHSVPENSDENTTISCITHLNNKLQMSLSPDQIDRSHRLCKVRSNLLADENKHTKAQTWKDENKHTGLNEN